MRLRRSTQQYNHATVDVKLSAYAEAWETFQDQMNDMNDGKQELKHKLWDSKTDSVLRRFDGCVQHRRWKASTFASREESFPKSQQGINALPAGLESEFAWFGTAGRSWLQLDMKARHIVTGFKFKGITLEPDGIAQTWIISDLQLTYSDDGFNWTPLQTKPGEAHLNHRT